MHLPRKLLIQMSGAPGSGKCTVANLLAPPIDAVVVNHDRIKAFFLESNAFFDQSGKLTYRLDWILAEGIIKQGWSVIIDCPCNFHEIIEQGTALARKYGYDYKYVECKVNYTDLLDRRLRNRVPLRSQRTGVDVPPPDAGGASHSEDYRALFTRWIEDPCRPSSSSDTTVVDSTGSPEECLHYILKQIVHPTGVQTSNPVTLKAHACEEGSTRCPEPTIVTYPYANPRPPAALGDVPALSPSSPVPHIFPSGYGFVAEHSA